MNLTCNKFEILKKEKKSRDFVHRAYYEGGTEALRLKISNSMVYPKEAIENKIQGTVKLSFEIDYLGNVHHAKVLSGLGYGCDEEALRLVGLLKYKVAKTYKLKVNFQKKLNIHFKLAVTKKVKTSEQNNSYQYTITNTKAIASIPKKKSGYSYTVNY